MMRQPRNASDKAPSMPNSLKSRIGLGMDWVKPARSAKIQEHARRQKEVLLSVEVGHLAAKEYRTPHTRQSADVAARVVQTGIIEGVLESAHGSINALEDDAMQAARDKLGQYYTPHARQAAQAAVADMLARNGYGEDNSDGSCG